MWQEVHDKGIVICSPKPSRQARNDLVTGGSMDKTVIPRICVLSKERVGKNPISLCGETEQA